jgi:hypothetical protein
VIRPPHPPMPKKWKGSPVVVADVDVGFGVNQ